MFWSWTSILLLFCHGNCATFKVLETRVWSSQNPRLSRTPSCYHHHSKMMLRIPREDSNGFLVMDIPTNLVLSRGLRNFQVTGNLGWPAKRGFRSQKVSNSSSSIMSTTRFRYFARGRHRFHRLQRLFVAKMRCTRNCTSPTTTNSRDVVA